MDQNRKGTETVVDLIDSVFAIGETVLGHYDITPSTAIEHFTVEVWDRESEDANQFDARVVDVVKIDGKLHLVVVADV